MPIYAYRCATCGNAKDVLQKMSDPLLSVCPFCGAPTFEKQVTAAGFQLKGSGWYVTDFRGDNKPPAAGSTDAKPDGAGKADAAKGEGVKSDAAAPSAPQGTQSEGSASPAPAPAAAPPAAAPSSDKK